MTKIYLVCREVYKGTMFHDNYVAGVFTNKKKALAFIRWRNAKDVEDKKTYANVYENMNPKNYISERVIENYDFTNAAIKLEIKNLPF